MLPFQKLTFLVANLKPYVPLVLPLIGNIQWLISHKVFLLTVHQTQVLIASYAPGTTPSLTKKFMKTQSAIQRHLFVKFRC